MTTEPLSHRLGCPSEFLPLRTADNLSADAGFFQFGPNVVCYGRSSNGWRSTDASQPLYDSFADVGSNCSELQMPFDVTEIIDNLCRERYAKRAGHGASGPLTKAYYVLRTKRRTRERPLDGCRRSVTIRAGSRPRHRGSISESNAGRSLPLSRGADARENRRVT